MIEPITFQKNINRKFGTEIQNMKIEKNELKTLAVNNQSNPQEVEIYQQQIFQNISEKPELFFGNFMNIQQDINEKMRQILIDWLVDVHLKFNLRDETLYLTQYIIDIYIAQNQIKRNKLQLLGITAMLIACKYEEIYPPQIKDFIHVTDNAYQYEEVLEMEGQVIIALNFNLNYISPLVFLNKFSKDLKIDLKNYYLARYLLELSLVDQQSVKFSARNIAAGALFMINKIRLKQIWTWDHIQITGYQETEIKTTAKYLCYLIQNTENSSLNAVKRKFSSEQYFHVSKLKLQKNN